MDQLHYTVVEFMNETSDAKKSVDLIPSTWISYNKELHELVAQFMPPPYDDENSALLHSLIKCAAPAAESWPFYSIAIRGEAKSYEEGLKKMKKLNKKKNAFSTDEEFASQDKAAMATDAYKNSALFEENLWDVPSLLDENDNLQYNKTTPDSESSSQSKKKLTHQGKKLRVIENKLIRKPRMSSDTGDEKLNSTEYELFDEMIPVIQEENVALQDIKTMIAKGFHAQSLHLAKISTQLAELKMMVIENSSAGKMSEVASFSCPAKKYKIDLPFKLVQDFLEFDGKLLDDDSFRDDMIASMWRIASICAPVAQTVRDILKKFISRDVMLQFTAVKDTGKKLVLSKTHFFSCVQDVVVAKYEKDEKMGPVSTKQFEQIAGKVINNAKDWEGHRATRK